MLEDSLPLVTESITQRNGTPFHWKVHRHVLSYTKHLLLWTSISICLVRFVAIRRIKLLKTTAVTRSLLLLLKSYMTHLHPHTWPQWIRKRRPNQFRSSCHPHCGGGSFPPIRCTTRFIQGRLLEGAPRSTYKRLPTSTGIPAAACSRLGGPYCGRQNPGK